MNEIEVCKINGTIFISGEIDIDELIDCDRIDEFNLHFSGLKDMVGPAFFHDYKKIIGRIGAKIHENKFINYSITVDEKYSDLLIGKIIDVRLSIDSKYIHYKGNKLLESLDICHFVVKPSN